MIEKYRFKTGIVVIDLFRNKGQESTKNIVLLYGFLGSPVTSDALVTQALLKEEYTIWVPHYEGTFASDGACTFTGAVATVIKTVDFIFSGKATESWGNKEVSWDPRHLIVAGASFGGTAALCAAAQSKKIKTVVALAAPADFKQLPSMERYKATWMRGWSNVWRIPDTMWELMKTNNFGKMPLAYAQELKEKTILFVYDKGDKIVPFEQSRLLVNAVKGGSGKQKLLALNEGAHLGIADIANKRILKEMRVLGLVA